MCGIFCAIVNSNKNASHENTDGKDCPCDLHICHCGEIKRYLRRRGPDKIKETKSKLTEDWRACFAGSVLWTQGNHPVSQPLQDVKGNFLLWNGDVLFGPLETNFENDSEVVFERLKSDPLSTAVDIGGPYAFVLWHAERRQLWFGRDVLGRVSLLWQVSPHHVTLASVAHKNTTLTEVPALGIYMVDLTEAEQVGGLIFPEIQFFPWAHLNTSFSSMSDFSVVTREAIVHSTLGDMTARLAWLDKEPSSDDLTVYETNSTFSSLLEDSTVAYRVEKLLDVLTTSVECRVNKHPGVCKNCVKTEVREVNSATMCDHCCVAVLFSGGLDSTILALLADKFEPESKPIDLYNVAFQQQSGSYEVPDRLTGRASLKELKILAPNRQWNFVEVDVSRDELDAERSCSVADLLHPLRSVLDDSLGCALWFAARGEGAVNGTLYTSPARVLLMGMGADEQLGGYTRHRNTLRRAGWAALGRELAADTDNIARRNLGRDNRVTCDHGRQPRAPYLDERVVAYLDTLPPWHRCVPVSSWPPGRGDKLLLRLAALRLGLTSAATLPKRALQFGSRIANPREKADQVSQRL